MQKEHMRQLKAESKSDHAPRARKGFVGQCLVKVESGGEESVTVEWLKVSV